MMNIPLWYVMPYRAKHLYNGCLLKTLDVNVVNLEELMWRQEFI